MKGQRVLRGPRELSAQGDPQETWEQGAAAGGVPLGNSGGVAAEGGQRTASEAAAGAEAPCAEVPGLAGVRPGAGLGRCSAALP